MDGFGEEEYDEDGREAGKGCLEPEDGAPGDEVDNDA